MERRTFPLFGKPYEVPCYGSCGCRESAMDLSGVLPSEMKWADIGMPRAYLGADADLRGNQTIVASGTSLYIHGPNRTGKTTYACAMAKALTNMGLLVRFFNAKTLMREFQGMASGGRDTAMERAYTCDVLVLDDLGKEQPTPFAMSMLYELVELRRSAGKPIVTTTNFSLPQLGRRWEKADAETAEAVIARLSEDVVIIEMGVE